jgi:creatinine amidohydrolase
MVSRGASDHQFARKTAAEVADVAGEAGSVLVVPVGSVEQHGDHLPVGTDTMLVTSVLDGALAKLDDVPALSTPAAWCGYSPHHLPFGGTISGEFDTLKTQLEEIADTALENGFDAVLFLNGHGGNTALIDVVTSEVGRAHPDVEALGATYFELATDLVMEVRDSDLGGMAHGGEFETSLLLHLDPDLVGEEMPAEHWDEPYELGGDDLVQGGPLAVYRSFAEYSESGAIGAPSLASAEKGERLYEGLTDALAALLREVHERNR